MSPAGKVNPAELKRALGGMSKDELVKLAKSTRTLQGSVQMSGPQNDDELWDWIHENLGLSIPRVAVVPGHSSPFQFIADCFFNRVYSALAMANRGGSKTFGVAVLHVLNARFKPQIESATIGAIEMQARRAYAHVQKLLKTKPEFMDEVEVTIMTETRWKNGSRLEVIPGTVSAVNGPHPQVVHFDEVELADPEAYYESRNCSQSNVKLGIKAQDIITSTRKSGSGLMQSILDEIDEAESEGRRPPFTKYVWSIWETAANVPNCRVAYPDLPEDQKCECQLIQKGRWDDGKPRIFTEVCGGKLAKSDGWIPIDDVHKTFLADSRDVWEAQIECLKPSTEGSVLARFDSSRYGLADYRPTPENGPVYLGVDWGGTNPHAAIWFQILNNEVEVTNAGGYRIRLPEGSVIIIGEVYKAEISNNRFADEVLAYESDMNQRWGIRVQRPVFCDPQGKAARLDWASHKTPDNRPAPIRTAFLITRDQKEHIKALVDLVDHERFYVMTDRCPMWVKEVGAWHYPRKRPGMNDDPDIPVNDFDHAMAATRYGVCNALFLLKRWHRQRGRASEPAAQTTRTKPQSMPAASAARYMDPGGGVRPWREAVRP